MGCRGGRTSITDRLRAFGGYGAIFRIDYATGFEDLVTVFDETVASPTSLVTIRGAQCWDGLDNGADGLIDYPTDPGCLDQASILESPACNDGLDNDGDGGIDFDGGPGMATPDPECMVAYRNMETPNPSGGCGLGAELALLMPSLVWLRRRRGARD